MLKIVIVKENNSEKTEVDIKEALQKTKEITKKTIIKTIGALGEGLLKLHNKLEGK
jgi:hypothetical protein